MLPSASPAPFHRPKRDQNRFFANIAPARNVARVHTQKPTERAFKKFRAPKSVKRKMKKCRTGPSERRPASTVAGESALHAVASVGGSPISAKRILRITRPTRIGARRGSRGRDAPSISRCGCHDGRRTRTPKHNSDRSRLPPIRAPPVPEVPEQVVSLRSPDQQPAHDYFREIGRRLVPRTSAISNDDVQHQEQNCSPAGLESTGVYFRPCASSIRSAAHRVCEALYRKIRPFLPRISACLREVVRRS